MKNVYPFIFLVCLASCTESITYETTVTTYSSQDTEMCAMEQCPILDLSIIHLEKPQRLKELVNNWVQDLSLQELNLLVDQDYKTINQAVEEYLNTAQIGYPETSVLSNAHEFTIDTALSFSSDELLSVVFYGYQFSGGASGFDTTKFLNANPQTGEEFTDETLFTGDFYAFAKAQFETQFPNSPFNIHSEETTIEDIGFTEEGVLIIYMDARILDLSTAQIQLLITWEEMEGYTTF